MNLKKLFEAERTIRVLGIDDAHYEDKTPGAAVNMTGIVCGGTRFEGMLWSNLTKDGLDATEQIISVVKRSKFHDQLHLILLDGITFGGANVADLSILHQELQLPIVAVMRKRPNLETFLHVLDQLPKSERRLKAVDAAGPIHEQNGWVFQCQGESPNEIARVLTRLTSNGKVPEALRIAHLIGSAVMLGESTKRA